MQCLAYKVQASVVMSTGYMGVIGGDENISEGRPNRGQFYLFSQCLVFSFFTSNYGVSY